MQNLLEYNLFDFCDQEENDGTSVWVFQGNKHLSYVCHNSTSLPSFNSNLIYCVIDCRHNISILNDELYASLHLYFWVGARCLEYDSCFDLINQDIAQLVDESEQKMKCRMSVEFQYAESSQFFSLFNRLTALNQPGSIKTYSCIQYQDYIVEGQKRAIGFPKFLYIERVESYYSSGQEFFIRIHERAKLNHIDASKLGIIKLEGLHTDENGLPLKLDSPYQIKEKVNGLQYAVGENCDADHKLIIKYIA